MTDINHIIKQAGGVTALADKLGISYQAIQQWQRVPPKHVLTIEALTGISRYDMRPDIYGEADRLHPQAMEKTQNSLIK